MEGIRGYFAAACLALALAGGCSQSTEVPPPAALAELPAARPAPEAPSDGQHRAAEPAKSYDRLHYVEQHTSPLDPARQGAKVADFKLADFYGQEHSLAALADKPVVVLVFLGTECPLARLYAPKLQGLADRYAEQGVAFLAIDSNVQDSVSEMREFALSHELKIPLLRDVNNQVADQLGATRTPEAFVLDRDRVVRYQGRIDDEFGFYEGTGYQRVREVRDHLRLAMDELLAGQSVSRAQVPAPGCLIGRARERQADGPVTWSRDVAPVLQAHCQTCHRPGTTAPFSLLTYEDTRGWEEMLKETVDAGRMPPWHASPKYGKFVNDPRLSDEEKRVIREWVECGAPEGDPADAPAPRKFRDQWEIQKPDLLLYISDEPVDIPASGLPHFKERLLDLNFQQDTWLDSIECRPDNRSVVHHMDVMVAPAGNFDEHLRAGRVRRMGGYVPGLNLTKGFLGDEDAAGAEPPAEPRILIPAGSQLLIDMHYKPNGRPQKDRSAVALRFAPPPPELPADVGGDELAVGEQSVLIEDTEFCIPPGESTHRSTATYTFLHPAVLNSLHAHMHVRGKSMLFEAFFPDGTEEILLDVPRYDYNWEHLYALAEPRRIPRGTRMRVTTVFDNSEDNPHNPDPTVNVFYGRGYYDQEMMSGTIGFQPSIVGFNRDEMLVLADRTRQQPVPQPVIEKLLAGYLKAEDVPRERWHKYYTLRGQFRQELDDLAGAAEDYSRAIEADASYVPAWLARANVRAKLRQTEPALEDYARVLDLDPNQVDAYIGRGKIVTDFRTALADFDRALALEPKNAAAAFHRAEAFEQAGDINAALREYARVIEQIHPGYLDAYLRRGALLYAAGREYEGQEQFETVSRLRPTMQTQVDYWWGLALFRKGRYAEALPHFDAYLAIVPQSQSIINMRGRSLLELKQYAEAIPEFEKLISLFGPQAESLHLLAIAEGMRAEQVPTSEERARLWASSVHHLRQVWKLTPGNMAVGLAIAEAFQTQGNLPDTLASYRQVLSRDPGNAQAAAKLAWLLSTEPDDSVRNGGEAVRLAETACRATKLRDVFALRVLAAALAECGRFSEATQALDRARALIRGDQQSAEIATLNEEQALYKAQRPLRRQVGPTAGS